MKHQGNLSEKMWWRALKAVYVLAWLASLTLVGLLSYMQHPVTSEDLYNIRIVCDNKKTYKFEPKKLDSILHKVYFTDSEKEYLKKLCAYGNDGTNLTVSVLNTNFKTERLYNNYGSWESVLLYAVVGFAFIFVVLEAIKSILLYILGIPLYKGGLKYLVEIVNSK